MPEDWTHMREQIRSVHRKFRAARRRAFTSAASASPRVATRSKIRSGARKMQMTSTHSFEGRVLRPFCASRQIAGPKAFSTRSRACAYRNFASNSNNEVTFEVHLVDQPRPTSTSYACACARRSRSRQRFLKLENARARTCDGSQRARAAGRSIYSSSDRAK
jgi:hypothetical protein